MGGIKAPLSFTTRHLRNQGQKYTVAGAHAYPKPKVRIVVVLLIRGLSTLRPQRCYELLVTRRATHQELASLYC